MVADTEVCIIGAGAVGLAAGHTLARAGRDVIVLERHQRAGTEISARNSEVVHAGLYYPPGSLKARLCRQGAKLLDTFCADTGVPLLHCGKLIVALGDGDDIALARLSANAAANGVDDLRSLSAADAMNLEPALACRGALLSASTAVFDSAAYVTALEGVVEAADGQIITQTAVTGITRTPDGLFFIETTSSGHTASMSCRQLILCGGLSATSLGRLIAYPNSYAPPETYFAKGHYYALTGPAPFSRLIYPLPSDGGLGIHFTRDCTGAAKFGPDIEWCETPDTSFNGGTGANQRQQRFETSIRRYWPGLPEGALSSAYSGIRPKLSRVGEPDQDFAIHTEAQHGIPNLVACYGIESPGLTASLAIGAWISQLLQS